MNSRGVFALAAAVLGSLAMRAAEPVILEGPALKKAVATAGAAKVLPSADVVTVQTGPGNRTAFYQQKLQWRTADIGQIVFTVKADKPGRLRFVCNTQLEDGKRLSVGIFRTVKPDGEFHAYGFPVGLQEN